MSEDDRPIPASERRLLRARERGMMPVRRAPVALCGVLGGAFAAAASGGAERLVRGVRTALDMGLEPAPIADATDVMGAIVWGVLAAVWPVCAGGMLGAVLGALAQTGGVLAWNRPRGSMGTRLQAMSGPGAWGRGAAGLLWAVVAIGVAGTAVWVQWADVAHLPRAPLGAAIGSGARIALTAAAMAAGALAVLAVIDALWARAAWHRSLAMTPQDAREEQRATDGDPTARAQRQRAARQWKRVRHGGAAATHDTLGGVHA